jgi:ABC-type Na+ efflux pump permease subunit
MNVQRIFARGFVIGGGGVWIIAALGSPYGIRTVSVLTSAVNSVALLALTVAVFVLGLFYEQLTGVLLLAGAVAASLYGLATGWEPGVWVTMTAVLIGPMLVAGALFSLAARMQDVCEHQETGRAREPAAPASGV